MAHIISHQILEERLGKRRLKKLSMRLGVRRTIVGNLKLIHQEMLLSALISQGSKKVAVLLIFT